jgi:CBS domain-containing protein
MRERNISRLPVVDEGGKLVGILGTMDLIKAIKQPHEKMSWYGMAAEMERIVSLPVSNVMNDRPPTAKKTDSLTDV